MARVNAPDPLAIAALVHIHIAVIGPELTLFTAPAPTCGQHRELCPALPALSGHAGIADSHRSCARPRPTPPTGRTRLGRPSPAPCAIVHGRERASGRQRPKRAAEHVAVGAATCMALALPLAPQLLLPRACTSMRRHVVSCSPRRRSQLCDLRQHMQDLWSNHELSGSRVRDG